VKQLKTKIFHKRAKRKFCASEKAKAKKKKKKSTPFTIATEHKTQATLM
jgi:hypothetical protein